MDTPQDMPFQQLRRPFSVMLNAVKHLLAVTLCVSEGSLRYFASLGMTNGVAIYQNNIYCLSTSHNPERCFNCVTPVVFLPPIIGMKAATYPLKTAVNLARIYNRSYAVAINP